MFKITLTLVLVSIAFYFLSLYLSGLILPFLDKSSDEVIGASVGSFFAFIFFILGTWYKKVIDRRLKNRNALVRLEYQLNEILDTVPTDIDIVEEQIKSLSNRGFFTPPFKYLDLDKTIIADLRNINLINDVFNYQRSIFRFNEYLKDVSTFNQKITDLKHSSQISQQEYIISADRLKDDLQQSLAFFRKIDSETEVLMAKVQVLYRKEIFLFEKILSKVRHWLMLDNYNEKEIQKRLVSLKAERSKVNPSL